MDFQCRVATYELRRADEIAAKQGRPIFAPPNMPHLVAVSPDKAVRPTRYAMNLAVGLLLRTQMPKWQAAQKRRTQEFAELERCFGRESAIKQQSSDPVDMDAEEFSTLERNVFLISRHIGLLRQHEFFPDFEKEGILIHESLEHWINAAQDIQTIFSNREARRGLQGDIGDFWPFHNLRRLQVERRFTEFASRKHASRADVSRGPNDRRRDNISDLQKLRYVVLRWRYRTREE